MARQVHSNLIRSVEELPEYTLYRYVGVPYGGLVNGHTDFHNTYATPNTDVGPKGRLMSTFFEHGLFPKIGFSEIGVARVAPEETSDGVLFEIIVERSNKYHDMIRKLYDKGILYVSAQALASGYSEDKQTGELLRFIPGEISFTVSPSNLLAKPYDPDTLRSIFTDLTIDEVRSYYNMANSSELEKTDAQPTTAVDPQPATASNPVEANTLVAQIRNLLDTATAKTETIRTDPNVAILDAVRELTATVQTIGAEVAALKTAQEGIVGKVKDEQEEVMRNIEDVKSSVLLLGETLTSNMTETVKNQTLAGILNVSESEKQVLQRRMAQTDVPEKVENTQSTVPTVGFTPPTSFR